MQSDADNYIDESATDDRIEEEVNGDNDEARECKSPTEGTYGDDESRDQDEEDEPRNRRRTKRNVRVEEGTEKDVLTRPGSHSGRLNRQSSSEDEIGLKKTRSLSGSKVGAGGKTFSSSEDEFGSTRRKPSLSKTSVRDRKASFEQSSESEQPLSSAQKRTSFSGGRANTIATSGKVAAKRESFSKTRATSVEGDLTRKQSADKPDWQSSTHVNHQKVEKNTMSRKESTTQSESDEPKSATQLRAKWEARGRAPSKEGNRTKAFGGSTGAAALKARFEHPRSGYARKTSSSNRSRTMSTDSEDGAPKKVSALALKARFESKNTEIAPVSKRNFIINKNHTGGAAKKFNIGAPTSNKCLVCSKNVYPLEKLEADGKMYHKFCFKCTTCNRTVGLGNYAALEGKIYCKPHLKQLFKLKGNYDEGFGRTQRKKDWVKKDENSVPSDGTDQVLENGHDASVDGEN